MCHDNETLILNHGGSFVQEVYSYDSDIFFLSFSVPVALFTTSPCSQISAIIFEYNLMVSDLY